MRSLNIISLILVMGLGLGCEKWGSKPPIPTEPPKEIEKPIDGEPQNGSFTIESRPSVVAIKFNVKYFPANTATVEIIYDGKYLGYWPINETILLPRLEGKRELKVNLVDANNQKIGPMRSFIVTNP